MNAFTGSTCIFFVYLRSHRQKVLQKIPYGMAIFYCMRSLVIFTPKTKQQDRMKHLLHYNKEKYMISKLYVVMVGLPARGKSTLAKRICEALADEGTKAAIFNNGDVRRLLAGPQSSAAEFYSPDNTYGREARENIALENMACARKFLSDGGDVAILDATNASSARRIATNATLTDYPILYIECVNEDELLQEKCIQLKCHLPEFKHMQEKDALACFKARIGYYEQMYTPVGAHERYWMRVDATANRILEESPCDGSPHYSAIRNVVVSHWVRTLYLMRHGQTEFNVQGRIGGDPHLTKKGRQQAHAMALHLRGLSIPWVFTSTRLRSYNTAEPILKSRPETQHMALQEFDEIWAGVCEGMLYEDIREQMPEVMQQRHADKYGYAYPQGESYAMLLERVDKGLRRALFLAGDSPLLIVGHQAVNRIILSLFLNKRTEDIPHMYIPQNQYYHISIMPRCKSFELVRFF